MDTQKLATISAALGNMHRMRIVGYLACGEMCAYELLRFFDFTQPTLSNHLKVLREAGIIRSRTHAKWTFYSLDLSLMKTWHEAMRDLCLGDPAGESYQQLAARYSGQGS